jgi:hypothetical protein
VQIKIHPSVRRIVFIASPSEFVRMISFTSDTSEILNGATVQVAAGFVPAEKRDRRSRLLGAFQMFQIVFGSLV